MTDYIQQALPGLNEVGRYIYYSQPEREREIGGRAVETKCVCVKMGGSVGV